MLAAKSMFICRYCKKPYPLLDGRGPQPQVCHDCKPLHKREMNRKYQNKRGKSMIDFEALKKSQENP
jgi:hypothetical protein